MIVSTGPDKNRAVPQQASGKSQAVLHGNELELVARTPQDDVFSVTRNIELDLKELRSTAWKMGGAGMGILLLGLAGGWWAAGRSLRPIAQISATAEKLSAANLGERVRLPETQDELGRLADVLNAMFARLDAGFTQQAAFISDAAHELRTPVSVMLTQTQTALLRERSAEDYRLSLEACQRAAGRMRQLIESLLALARLDSGQQKMKRLRFDLARAITEQVELLAPLAEARQISIGTDLTPVVMEGDPDYLTMAVSNLLTNAIHYNREAGSIRISLTHEETHAVLTVTDTGEGMERVELARIFDRFYRADQSRSLPAGRTGLGLAITKSIVDATRGTITVESTPGTGTTFTIRLPLGS